MAEYRRHRLDRTWMAVSLDDVFSVFRIAGLIKDYAIDTWLFDQGHIHGEEPIDALPDEALTDWVLSRSWEMSGTENQGQHEFEEFCGEISLTQEEQREAASRVRELMRRRTA